MPLSSLKVIPSKCNLKVVLGILCFVFCVALLHLLSSHSFLSHIPSYIIASVNDYDISFERFRGQDIFSNGSDITAHNNITYVTYKYGYGEVNLSSGNTNFPTPYVVKSHIYPNVNSSSRIPPLEAVKRNYTIVSTYNSPKWFQKNILNTYNVGLQSCPVKECYIDNVGLLKSKADVLLFFPGKSKLPTRKAGQIWAFCSWESPEYYGYPTPYDKWKDKFNWTVSYRADADWFFPNNQLTWRDPSTLLEDNEYTNNQSADQIYVQRWLVNLQVTANTINDVFTSVSIAKRKTKMVAWWVSHCNTKSQREKYVKEMQKYISVDIYGKCGNYTCSKTNISECERLLTTTYRFYLSFENSLCLDYVSEKFFRMFAYRTHVVPVGRSGFDYNKYIPGNFVVDAKNFNSAKSLALYLKYLANDIPRYAKMLKEKDKLVALNRKVDWCEVCEKLRTKQYRNHLFRDIRQWSHGRGLCRGPNDIMGH